MAPGKEQMSVYRRPPQQLTIILNKRSLFGKFRSWRRRQLMAWYGGTFLQRHPVKCPECGHRSWDPYVERNKNEFSREALWRMNYYRCDHRGDLKLMLRWM